MRGVTIVESYILATDKLIYNTLWREVDMETLDKLKESIQYTMGGGRHVIYVASMPVSWLQ